LFWGFFHLLAPPILFYLGMRHRITHSFAFGPTYALFLQPLRWIKRIPLSLFLRADTIENHRIKGRRQWLIRLEIFLEGLAISGVHLYGVSEVLTSSVVERHSFFKPLTSDTLRNDIQCSQHEQDVEPHKPIRMACVGVLEQRKNQALILQSLESLAPYSPYVDVYGSGPDREKLEQFAQELGVDQWVEFKGWLPVGDIWPQVDLLLMPSLHEGAPNAVLEAMERGIPVLASDIPEHREILPADALLSLEDVNQWVSRLAKILDEPDSSLRKLRDAQNDCAKKLYFDWNARFLSSVLCLTVGAV
jgi:glycosyltransferase involved in cell wall biosynthesis